MKRLIAFWALLAGCVNGRELVAPDDPSFTALCVDSTVTDSTKVCWDPTSVDVVIVVPNPDAQPEPR